MNTATKNKSLISIIIFLLITNVAMVVFFLVLNNPVAKSSRERDPNGMSGMLQKEVGFTKDQVGVYQSLRKEHSDSIHMLFDNLRKSKTDFYNLMYSPQVPDSSVNKAADLIAGDQKMLDLHMLSHFKMVRNICTADQLLKFDTSIKKVISRMTARPGRENHDHQ